MRTPLPAGTIISMPNGAAYTLDDVIGEGGFSIVYRAHTAGGNAAVVIKEFYPASYGTEDVARRDEHGSVCAAPGQTERFIRLRDRFEREGMIGGMVAGETHQAIPFIVSGNGYAVMQRISSDMTSVEALVSSWSQCPPLPYSGHAGDGDPCFTGLTRLSYSLRVVDSLLSALESIHRRGMLHLDLSPRNVLWAGREQATGRNCTAVLADFGCAAHLTDGEYRPVQPLSFSPGFAAPEMRYRNQPLTPATDVYAAGVLLLYLCCGRDALSLQNSPLPFACINRLISRMTLPQTVRGQLTALIHDATARPQAESSLSAAATQAGVRSLLNMLPQRPINPDVSDAFTLCSLRSMIEGANGANCTWADELCDRRGKMRGDLPEGLDGGLSFRIFDSDEDFLHRLLPIPVCRLLEEKLLPDAGSACRDVMTCNYPQAVKAEICRLFPRIGTRELVQKCNTLLDSRTQFSHALGALWMLLDEDGVRLRDSMQRIHAREYPAAGLALLVLYALLGKEYFPRLITGGSVLRSLFPPSVLR